MPDTDRNDGAGRKGADIDDAFGGWTDASLDDADEAYISPPRLDDQQTQRERVTLDHAPSPQEATAEEDTDTPDADTYQDPLYSGMGRRRDAASERQADTPEAYEVPPRPDLLNTSAATGRLSKDKLKKAGGLAALVIVVIGAGSAYKHLHSYGPAPQPTQATASSVSKQPSSPKVNAPVAAATAQTVKSSAPSPQAVPTQLPPAVGQRPASPQQSASNESALLTAVGGIKGQLSTLETQLATQRSNGVSKKDLQGINHQIKALKDTMAKLQGQVGGLTKHLSVGTATQPVLSGYKLLDVVGHQAIIEDMGTGQVASLKDNGSIGNMTVYQVASHEVVTNYGVFTVT